MIVENLLADVRGLLSEYLFCMLDICTKERIKQGINHVIMSNAMSVKSVWEKTDGIIFSIERVGDLHVDFLKDGVDVLLYPYKEMVATS